MLVEAIVETGDTGSWLMDASERGSDSLSEQESSPDNKTRSCSCSLFILLTV